MYHGLVVGPLHDAALFLDRLMTDHLLPPHLMEAMREPHLLDRSYAGTPLGVARRSLGSRSALSRAVPFYRAIPASDPVAPSPYTTLSAPSRP